ncbi:MAG TPA: hypothetical protein VGK73_12245 [Polyangiaceae bacterium]
MDPELLLEELTRALVELGVEVRSHVLRGTHPSTGGLCRIGGRHVVLLNSRATPLERGTVLAHALSELGFDRFESLREETRLLVQRGGRPRPMGAPRSALRPGLAHLGPEGRRRQR